MRRAFAGALLLALSLPCWGEARADPADANDPVVVLQCEVWGVGGEGGFHLYGYAQGLGGSHDEAQADAERDMQKSFGFAPKLGHCIVVN